MNLKKLFCLLFISAFLCSFSLPNDTKEYSIQIIKSSEPLDNFSFPLKENTILLKSDKKYKLSVEIKSKKVSGKELLSDYSKRKRTGIQYKVIYTYEHLPSGKKNNYRDKYVVWENGEIINLRSAIKINVGQVSLQTKIQKK